MKRRRIISIVQGVIAVIILLLLVSSIDPQLTLSLLTHLDIGFILLAGLCYFLNNLLMAYRIKKILFAMGENIRLRVTFFSHMAGMLLSDFTPARSGYLYVAIALNDRDVPMEKGIATITSTYLYDLTFKMIVAILGAYFLYSYIFADRLSLAIITTFLLIIAVIAGYVIIMHPGERLRTFLQKREFLKKVLVFGEQSRSIQKFAPFILSITLIGWILRGLQWFLICTFNAPVFSYPARCTAPESIADFVLPHPAYPGRVGDSGSRDCSGVYRNGHQCYNRNIICPYHTSCRGGSRSSRIKKIPRLSIEEYRSFIFLQYD